MSNTRNSGQFWVALQSDAGDDDDGERGALHGTCDMLKISELVEKRIFFNDVSENAFTSYPVQPSSLENPRLHPVRFLFMRLMRITAFMHQRAAQRKCKQLNLEILQLHFLSIDPVQNARQAASYPNAAHCPLL